MKTREELLTLIPKNGIGAEIGVFEGAFSEIIYSTTDPKKLYLVDLFEGPMCSGDKNGGNMKHIILEDAYKILTEKYKEENRISFFKGKSEIFLNSLPDNYLDFIYIDGDHSYEGCKIDLNLAKTKVKKNGIIAGHDYCNMFTAVMRAVDEFVSNNNLTLNTTTEDICTSFLIINN
jgi:hypothetical protein